VTPALRILRAGPASTVQDGGRHGLLRYGVTPAGPMDWRAQAIACGLAGNPPSGAVIEVGPGGIDLEAAGAPVRLGIAAPRFALTLDGRPRPEACALTLAPGQVLSLTPAPGAVWGCIAARGGFALAPVMGSLSTHLRSGLGPLGGRALEPGNGIPLTAEAIALPDDETSGLALPRDDDVIRFLPGPQEDRFTDTARETLASAVYRVSPQSDRMGYRLTGPKLTHSAGHDIVSDGIALGSIQVPGDGLPIVLMADRQPTGGYPKIGTVIRADLPKLAQSPAGRFLRFQPVTRAAAVDALAHARALCSAIVALALRDASAGTPPEPGWPEVRVRSIKPRRR
jgi:5-oxoprolinase (ATP-hydrolysing) subunit C